MRVAALISTVLALSAAAAVSACGSAARLHGAAGQANLAGADSSLLKALPALPVNDRPAAPLARTPLREGSAIVEMTVEGDDFYFRGPGAVTDSVAHSMTLTAPPALPCLVIYRFSGLLSSDVIEQVDIVAGGNGDAGTLYVAVSNYGTGQWDLTEAALGTSTSTLNVPLPVGTTKVSPAGNMYLALLVYDGQPAVVFRSTALIGRIPQPPATLTASDGLYSDKVQLDWEASTSADSYNIYFKETGEPETSWEILTSVDAPATTFNHTLTQPTGKGAAYGQSYDYRISSVLSSEEGTAFSPVDSGFRSYPQVQDVVATDGIHADMVVISWTNLGGGYFYRVYYKLATEDETAWQILQDNVPAIGNHFDHTYAVPLGKECAYATVYDYYVVAKDFSGQEGVLRSNVDSGYRIVAAPAGFSASDRTDDEGVLLKWTASPGAESHNIYREATLIDTVDGMTEEYLDTTVPDEAAYDYWVRGEFQGEESDESNHDVGAIMFWDRHAVSADDPVDNLGFGVVNGIPALCYGSDTEPQLSFYSASSPEPLDMTDWSGHSAADGAQLKYGSSVVEYQGVPCIAYVDISTANPNLMLARAASATPDDPTDWTLTYVSDIPDTAVENGSFVIMKVIAGRLAILYASKDSLDNTHLHYFRALLDNPVNPGNWNVTDAYTGTSVPVGYGLLNRGEVPAVAWCVDGNVHYARATSASPTGPGDWLGSQVSTGPQTIASPYCLEEIDGMPAIAYLSAASTTISYARALVADPVSSSDWSVTPALVSISILEQCALSNWNGRPAMAVVEASLGVDTLVFLWAGNPAPSGPTDWDSTPLYSSAGSIDDVVGIQTYASRPAVACIDYDGMATEVNFMRIIP